MDISMLINDFMKQRIQSEAEVRSKLIVPLLELLEYPKDFRAEEFPVYGYEGSKALKTKAADFIQFTSDDFSAHRGKSDQDLEWVYKHSLLIFEAKKPTKEMEKRQPVFYAAWTKSVAYVISNGIKIEGYLVNANYSDNCVFSCEVEEIPEKWEKINLLNYHRILELKKSADQNGEWTNRDPYENYKNVMRIRCSDELYACVDRNLKEFTYDFNLIKNRKGKKFEDILDNTCKIITSDPGGGKTFLMWMLMREYLSGHVDAEEKIPVILEGRYYGRVYHSIVDGIYSEFHMLVPFMTKERIEERIRQGGFVILFDALDEVAYKYDALAYDLHRIRRNTANVIILTSRMQNYKRDFCTEFIHYSLEPLDDAQIMNLLKQYSRGRMEIGLHQIPKRLLEVIRTPLFLRLFVSISKRGERYLLPSNHADLFQQYIAEKMRVLSCTLYEERMIRSILGEYALYSFENGDNTDQFFEILNEICDGTDKQKFYEKLWKTGLIFDAAQGIKYFHRAMQEFFVAVKLSVLDDDKIKEWLDKNGLNDKYDEVICYLTSILSNQHKQNFVLDYLERHHLNLFIRALRSRRNFDMTEQELDLDYAQSYYTQLLKTYDAIIKTFFPHICHTFDGYNIRGNGKLCIRGDISFREQSISMTIYDGLPETKTLDITLSEENGAHMITPSGEKIPLLSSVFTTGRTHIRHYSLGLLSFGFDSSREIAVDIIKSQIKDALKRQTLFDIDIDVLLAERIEMELSEFRDNNRLNCSQEKLSLYSNDISIVMDEVKKTGIDNEETDRILTFCEILNLRRKNADTLLDMKPDLGLEAGRDSYCYDELYSDEQLVRKVKKILKLSQEAIVRIGTDIIPVLGLVRPNMRTIGIVHRKDGCAGVSYINVKVEAGMETDPIIEFRENDICAYPELDAYYRQKLKGIGRKERDIMGTASSDLSLYFGDHVFHNMIYSKVKDLFEKILGR